MEITKIENVIIVSSSKEVLPKVAKLISTSPFKFNKLSLLVERKLFKIYKDYYLNNKLIPEKYLNEIRDEIKKNKILLVYIKIKGTNKENLAKEKECLLDHLFTELLPVKFNIPIFVLNISNTNKKEIEKAAKAINISLSGNRAAQVNLVVCRKNKENKYEVLTLLRNVKKGSFWQTITGGAHLGENFYSAVIREAKEEIGLKLTLVKYTNYHFNFIALGIYELNEYVYVAEISKEESKKIKISSEHDRFKWLSEKSAIEIVKYDSNKKAIGEAIKTLE